MATEVQPEKAFGIDLGTTFAAVTSRVGNKTERMPFPGVGEQLPGAVFIPDDGDPLLGTKARAAAYKQPDRLYTHFKRGMLDAADKPWNGGPSPIELTAALLKYVLKVILETQPDTKAYLDGTKAPELAPFVLTHPASLGVDGINALRKAASLAELPVNAVIAEPVAGATVFREECGGRLRERDLVAVFDIGGGTTDISLLQFGGGKFDVVVGAMGDPRLGGLNYTGAIDQAFCEELGIKASCYSEERGFECASGLSEEEYRIHGKLWEKAEEAKLQLSTMDEANVYVELPDGLKEFRMTRDEFYDRTRPLNKRLGIAVGAFLETCPSQDLKHVLLIGGGAMIPGMMEDIGNWTGRDAAAVYRASNSTHVVADGASYQGYTKDERSQCLPGGLGIRLRNGSGSINKMFFGTGVIVPPEGLLAEEAGQFVESNGRVCIIEMCPVEAKPGVLVKRDNGKAVLLTDEEVIALPRIRHRVQLPLGKHKATVAFSANANGDMRWVIAFPGLPGIDGLSGSLSEGSENSEGPSDVVIVNDCSGSMSKDDKLVCAKSAARWLVQQGIGSEDRIGLVRFGKDTGLVHALGSDRRELVNGIDSMDAIGNTPMAEALALAEQELQRDGDDRNRLVILVTDGNPNSIEKTISAADRVKQLAWLVTVGIGSDVHESLLMSLASDRDYYFAEKAEDLKSIFEQIAELHLDTDGREGNDE